MLPILVFMMLSNRFDGLPYGNLIQEDEADLISSIYRTHYDSEYCMRVIKLLVGVYRGVSGAAMLTQRNIFSEVLTSVKKNFTLSTAAFNVIWHEDSVGYNYRYAVEALSFVVGLFPAPGTAGGFATPFSVPVSHCTPAAIRKIADFSHQLHVARTSHALVGIEKIIASEAGAAENPVAARAELRTPEQLVRELISRFHHTVTISTIAEGEKGAVTADLKKLVAQLDRWDSEVIDPSAAPVPWQSGTRKVTVILLGGGGDFPRYTANISWNELRGQLRDRTGNPLVEYAIQKSDGTMSAKILGPSVFEATKAALCAMTAPGAPIQLVVSLIDSKPVDLSGVKSLPDTSTFVQLAQATLAGGPATMSKGDLEKLHSSIKKAFGDRVHIPMHEFKKWLIQNTTIEQAFVDGVYNVFDVDGDGTVDLRELVAGYALLSGSAAPDLDTRLLGIFDAFDVQPKDGFLSEVRQPRAGSESSTARRERKRERAACLCVSVCLLRYTHTRLPSFPSLPPSLFFSYPHSWSSRTCSHSCWATQLLVARWQRSSWRVRTAAMAPLRTESFRAENSSPAFMELAMERSCG